MEPAIAITRSEIEKIFAEWPILDTKEELTNEQYGQRCADYFIEQFSKIDTI